MSDNRIDMVDAAKGLARNPLSIIALFIVLVYVFASLVLAASFIGKLTPNERLPLIYFVVLFPVIVLAVFTWIVNKHSGKLFTSFDFDYEENYVKKQLDAVVPVQETAQMTGWRNHILWVDDCPGNNIYARQEFEAAGLKFSLALSTDEALAAIARQKFAAVISDMGRKEGPREGYVLLDAMRAKGNKTPLFFYAGSNDSKHKQETYEHGGQGCTNNSQELFLMLMKAITRGDN